MSTVLTHTEKPPRLHASSAMSWLLLGIWLSYSAAMLWHIKVISFGTASICHYVPPK